MRFHVLGLQHTITRKDYNACAYTMKVLKFGKMMTRMGHEVIHYGHEDSELECTEHVPVLSREIYNKVYGDHDYKSQFFKYDTNDEAYTTFDTNAIEEIKKRKQPGDFLLPFWGWGAKRICDAHSDMNVVEPGAGYAGGYFAPFKVFESYALYHAYYGLPAVGQCKQSNYDVVIPNYFDPDDFEYCDEKDDYFLYLGRVYEGKGVHIAAHMAHECGITLKVAGQGTYDFGKWADNVEVLGYADVEKRKQLLSKAAAVIMPSQYVEPFGGVCIEAFFSGTPVISSDWGAFTENNLHGYTGFRCRTFDDYVWAGKNVDKIKPIDCRRWAGNFELTPIGHKYEQFFQSILDLKNGKGWYEEHPEKEWIWGPYRRHLMATVDSILIRKDLEKVEATKFIEIPANKDTQT